MNGLDQEPGDGARQLRGDDLCPGRQHRRTHDGQRFAALPKFITNPHDIECLQSGLARLTVHIGIGSHGPFAAAVANGVDACAGSVVFHFHCGEGDFGVERSGDVRGRAEAREDHHQHKQIGGRGVASELFDHGLVDQRRQLS